MKSGRFFLISVFALSLFLSLSACSKTDETKKLPSEISESISDETITNTDIEQAKKRAFELASHYKDIYKSAKKTINMKVENENECKL